jgi:hypothetical protein
MYIFMNIQTRRDLVREEMCTEKNVWILFFFQYNGSVSGIWSTDPGTCCAIRKHLHCFRARGLWEGRDDLVM